MNHLIKQIENGLTEIEIEQANKYASEAVSETTKKAYSTDWRLFTDWCEERGASALPADKATVLAYLLYMANVKDLRVSTMERRLSSINVAHSLSGHDKPARVGDAHLSGPWKGIKKKKGTRKTKKEPLRIEDIRAICESFDGLLIDLRDKAILLVGFAGGFRRSELALMRVQDITFVTEGVKILLPRSKRDQEGKGLVKGIVYGSNPATCPVRSLKTWLSKSGIESGFVFRSITKGGVVSISELTGHSIGRIIKKLCDRVGLDSEQYGGHSLRSGFCTEASRNGASELRTMRHSGHKDRSTFEGYVHDGQLFENNPTSLLGL